MPICGFDNAVDAKSCSQCYFEFEKPMRDQGSMPSAVEQNEVYNLLMAETEEFNQDDDYAIEAVLTWMRSTSMSTSLNQHRLMMTHLSNSIHSIRRTNTKRGQGIPKMEEVTIESVM